jgi:hypothetical protein
MGWVLISGSPNGVAFFLCARKTGDYGAPALFFGDRKTVDKKAFHAFEDFGGRMRRMYDSSKLAAVPHAMGKPACELLHFAYTIGQLGSINLPIVVHE